MPDIILRGGRAQRVDVRVAKNQYTPSDRTVISSGTDPTTLTMQGLWRPDFPGSPWPGTASLGGSGTSPDRDLEAGNVGGGGTPVNGYTPFFCDGATIYMVGNAAMTWGDLIGSTNGDFYIHVLAQWNSAAATVGVLDDPALITDNGGSYALTYSTSGVEFACYDNSGTPQLRTVGPAAAASGSYHMIQVWWDSAADTMWLQVDGGTAVSASLFSSDFGAGNSVKVGVNWSDLAFVDGDILEIAVTNDKLDATIRENIRGYVQNKYAIAQGFSGTYTVPSTEIHPLLFPRAVITGYANEDVYLYVDTDYVAPAVVPTYTQWVIDHVPAALALRARVLAAHQMHASVANVLPIVPPAAPNLVAVYAPEMLKARSRPLADSVLSIPPRPERTSPLATTIAPDRTVRPTMLASVQPHGVMPAPKPEQRGPTGDVEAPDMVRRPSLATALHQASTTIAAYPERSSTLAAAAAPDRVHRHVVAASQQQASTTLSPAPERTFVLPTTDATARVPRAAVWMWAVDDGWLDPYPIPPVAPLTPVALTVQSDVLRRSGFRYEAHQATGLAPVLERKSPMASTDAPHAVLRPVYRAAHQQTTPSTHPAPERTTPIASTDAPVMVRRPWIGVAIQQAHTTVSPAPERTTALATTLSPDRVVRMALRPDGQQHGTTVPAAPERSSPMAWSDAPVAVVRPVLRVDKQQAATTVSPAPERTTALAVTDAPARAVRPYYATQFQQPATSIAAAPERTRPLAAQDAPVAVFRPRMGVGGQQALAVALQPPVVPPAPLGVPLTEFPPATRRQAFHASHQVATETLWPFPIPNEPAPIRSWAPSFPDTARRPIVRPVDQQHHAMAPRPERTAPLAAVMMVDRPNRPVYSVAVQQAATTTPAKPERPAPLAATGHPDRIQRPALQATQQQTAAASLYPERQTAIAAASFPDAVRRPSYRSEVQHAWTSSPAPERTTPIATAIDVHSVRRPAFVLALQQRYATQVQPPPPPVFVGVNWSTSFQDEVRRPVLSTAHQWAAWSTFTPSIFSVTDPLNVVLAGLVSAADVVELVSIPVLGPHVSRADIKDIVAIAEASLVSRKA